jgi:hypothetical protein
VAGALRRVGLGLRAALPQPLRPPQLAAAGTERQRRSSGPPACLAGAFTPSRAAPPPQVAEHATGRLGRLLLEVCICASNLGCIVAFLNILADTLSSVAGTIIPPGAEPSRGVYMTGAGGGCRSGAAAAAAGAGVGGPCRQRERLAREVSAAARA